MKKSILNVALLSMLFVLGACSAAAEGDFLKKVEGKTVYITVAGNEQEAGKFSADGKTYLNMYNFVEASDDSTATYKYDTYVLTIKTTDGKSGTIATALNGKPEGDVVAITLK